ncbi:MAG: hypothetical protein QOD42_734 [Sphingomonadales bacterium]|jgi:hypothetical protein|nr:hypothetical protein [Sphingomonadales bacterium]
MFSTDSRYASQPTLDHVRADGEPVRYVQPRILPQPEQAQIAQRYRATDSDRLDLLAYRNLGAPTAWWMIADANRTPHPAALPGAPGDTLTIPIPGTGKIPG